MDRNDNIVLNVFDLIYAIGYQAVLVVNSNIANNKDANIFSNILLVRDSDHPLLGIFHNFQINISETVISFVPNITGDDFI